MAKDKVNRRQKEITLQSDARPFRVLKGGLGGEHEVAQSDDEDEEIPMEIKEGMEVCPCESVEEVLKMALRPSNPGSFLKVVGPKILDDNSANIEVVN